jgi:hypothetical protein
VAQHRLLGEQVVQLGRLAEVAQIAVEPSERRDLRARAPREDRGEPEVVDVLVGPESIKVSGESSIRYAFTRPT